MDQVYRIHCDTGNLVAALLLEEEIRPHNKYPLRGMQSALESAEDLLSVIQFAHEVFQLWWSKLAQQLISAQFLLLKILRNRKL